MDVSKKIKNKFDFQQYYQEQYSKVITRYYDLIKEKRNSNIGYGVLLGIIVEVIYFIIMNLFKIKEIFEQYYVFFTVGYLVIVVVYVFISIHKSLKKELYKISEYIIKDMIAFASDNELENVKYEPKQRVSKESFDRMDLFNLDIVQYNGENYINVLYEKKSMVFSDMHTYVYDIVETKRKIYKQGKKYIRTTRKKQKRTIFKGLYIGATLNKKNTNQIYLIPNNLKDTVIQSKIMSYIKYHGTAVMLENLDFSKKYKVFCDDEVQARYILSLSLMEKINELDNLFEGKKYIVFKEGKRFAICIEGLSIEEVKKNKLPIFRNEVKEIKILSNVFEQLNNLFMVYHVLDLGNNLYVKE